MKKLLLTIAAIALLTPTASAFSDVPTDHPNFAAITALQELNVIGGYEDGTFKPENTVNRVEALKILLLGSQIQLSDNLADPAFDDTDASQWYAPYLAEAVDQGIVAGYPDGTFQPLKSVNLVEALKMVLETDILNGNRAHTEEAYPTDLYADTQGVHWYDWYLSEAKTANLIEPDQQNNVYPNQELTRGKLAEIMYRMLWINQKNETQKTFDLPLLTSYRTELILNSLDVDNESDRIDFDKNLDGIDFPSSDIWLGSLSINGNWTRDVDWWVIDMSAMPKYEGMEMTEIFDAIKECPEEGYAQIDNPDEDGFGEPRRASSGTVYCLRTNEFHYAKVEVIDAYSENFGDDKYLKFRYIYRENGSLELP